MPIMTKEKQSHSLTSDSLAARHKRHAKRLKKVEKARTRLEKANRKLRALEDDIATLVHSGATARQHAALLFNPQSKGVRDGTYRLEQIVDCLRAYGFDLDVGMKSSGHAGRAFVRTAVEQGADL